MLSTQRSFDVSDRSDVDAHIADVPDETMHVQLERNGQWHRELQGGRETACGVAIVKSSAMIQPFAMWNPHYRREAFVGAMCLDGCFSRHELTKAAIANREAAAEPKETP